MKTHRLLTGLILFLIFTNLATVVTVVHHIRKNDTAGVEEPHVQNPPVSQDSGDLPDSQRTLFFTKALKLSTDQQSAFREINWNYGRKSQEISNSMSQLRDELLTVLDQNEPDTALLNELSDQIGQKHTELKKLTITYYLGLKSICDEGQRKSLYEMFRKLLGPESTVTVPGGRQQGRGPWWRQPKDTTVK